MLASRALSFIGVLVAGVLLVAAGRYGYHRDELYFLAAGHHLAWGYADQGPVTPLIARGMDALAPGSLTALRVPSALMTAGTIITTGAITFELGGTRRAQIVAASCAAVASVVLVVGHLLSTTTFDLLAWAVVTWLVARAIRTGERRPFALAGVVAGVALLNKPLIGFLLLALGAGIAVAGPRAVLRSAWLWAGVLAAVVLALPWVLWQAHHGWPQLDVSSSIANGGSGSSQPRWALLPFQLLLVSPLLAPVWIVGLAGLLRGDRLRPFRCFAVAWIVLVAVFLVSGGKPYYLAGLFPVLLAAGAIRTDAWLDRGAAGGRRLLLGAAVILSGLVSAVIALPVLPARDIGPVISANADAGETIGWPDYARTVARVYREAHGPAVIFTSNYGEAGAVDRYGPGLGLPRAYSGHNGYWYWGPPPDRRGPVVLVGLDRAQRSRFLNCHTAARVDNAAHVDNDERGTAIDLCSGTRRPWSAIWPGLEHLG